MVGLVTNMDVKQQMIDTARAAAGGTGMPGPENGYEQRCKMYGDDRKFSINEYNTPDKLGKKPGKSTSQLGSAVGYLNKSFD